MSGGASESNGGRLEVIERKLQELKLTVIELQRRQEVGVGSTSEGLQPLLEEIVKNGRVTNELLEGMRDTLINNKRMGIVVYKQKIIDEQLKAMRDHISGIETEQALSKVKQGSREDTTDDSDWSDEKVNMKN